MESKTSQSSRSNSESELDSLIREAEGVVAQPGDVTRGGAGEYLSLCRRVIQSYRRTDKVTIRQTNLTHTMGSVMQTLGATATGLKMVLGDHPNVHEFAVMTLDAVRQVQEAHMALPAHNEPHPWTDWLKPNYLAFQFGKLTALVAIPEFDEDGSSKGRHTIRLFRLDRLHAYYEQSRIFDEFCVAYDEAAAVTAWNVLTCALTTTKVLFPILKQDNFPGLGPVGRAIDQAAQILIDELKAGPPEWRVVGEAGEKSTGRHMLAVAHYINPDPEALAPTAIAQLMAGTLIPWIEGTTQYAELPADEDRP